MKKNEAGFVIPIMLAITFIVAYLLLMLGNRLEIKAASFERTRDYMVISLLEQEGLERIESFLQEADPFVTFTSTWTLSRGAIMRLNIAKREGFFDFRYQILYNGNVRIRNLSFCLEDRVTILN